MRRRTRGQATLITRVNAPTGLPEGRAAYLELFQAPLDERTLARIREAINTDSAFGSEAFIDRLEVQVGRSARVPIRGRPAKSVTGKLL